MIPAPAILIVDSDPGDSTLSALLLRRDLPHATVTVAPDALAFADAVVAGGPDVAIVAADLTWARVDDLISTIKRRRPGASVILFGHEPDVVTRALAPGIACDGLVRKNSAGFLGLATIVTEVIERAQRGAARETPVAVQPPGAGDTGYQEMRDIALACSHDLKEPLQQIARLARRGQAGGDEQVSTRALQRVLECVDRASGMLDGMLEYLSIAGRDAAPAPVDLNVCLKQAIDNLRSTIEEAQAEIVSAPLPTVMGDEHQLLHLFQNLLSNAIKFRGRQRPAMAISVEARGTQWQIAFRDNGISVPAAFVQRIFEMGQRLHTREEYPGTGIGLALCTRIVERHGGRIWVEPYEGGSTFYVLLPRTATDGGASESATVRKSSGE